MSILIKKDGRLTGPYDLPKIEEELMAGRLTPDLEVYHVERNAWQTLKECIPDELLDKVQQARTNPQQNHQVPQNQTPQNLPLLASSEPSFEDMLQQLASAQGGAAPIPQLQDTLGLDGARNASPQPQAPPLPPEPQKSEAEKEIEEDLKNDDTKIDRLTVDNQNIRVISRILKKAEGLLTASERVDYIAVQSVPFIFTLFPDAILLTNKRIMIVRPKMFKMTFEDYLWREVVNVHMSEQMVTATITCTTTSRYTLKINRIPKVQARKIYTYSQEVEEMMYEVRRIRDIEERRGMMMGGGGMGGNPMAGPEGSPESVGSNDLGTLHQLKHLVSRGQISPKEYEARKADIIRNM